MCTLQLWVHGACHHQEVAAATRLVLPSRTHIPTAARGRVCIDVHSTPALRGLSALVTQNQSVQRMLTGCVDLGRTLDPNNVNWKHNGGMQLAFSLVSWDDAGSCE